MNSRLSYVDRLNDGRQRKPSSALDDITLTLNRLERHLGRAFEPGGSEDEITHRIKRLADEEAATVASPVRVHEHAAEKRNAPFDRFTRETGSFGSHDHQLESVSSLARELRTLRSDMRTMINSSLREEFSFLRNELNSVLASIPRSRDTADLEASLAGISHSISELSERDDRDTRYLQLEMGKVKAAIVDLLHAEQAKAGDPYFGGNIHGTALDALQDRLDQVVASIGHLPDSLAIRSLDDRVRQLALSLEQLALRAQSEHPQLLGIIDERLDEISRAIAASAALARKSGLDSTIIERIDARIGSLASQINEIAEDAPSGAVIEHLTALSNRVDDLASRLQAPEEALERLTHYVGLISERLESVAMPPEAEQMLRGIELHLVQLSDAFVRHQADALHQSTHLFHELERKLEAVASRFPSGEAGAADSTLLAMIDDRFSDLARRIDDVREIEDERALHALETRLESMASKLYSVTNGNSDPRILRKLESQVSHLSSLLTDPAKHDVSLGRSQAQDRAALIEATRQAAEEALAKFAASQKSEPMDARLQDEIQKLEHLTRQSAEKNSKTFDAINDTLLKIVTRLGTLETADDGDMGRDTALSALRDQDFSLSEIAETPAPAPLRPKESTASHSRIPGFLSAFSSRQSSDDMAAPRDLEPSLQTGPRNDEAPASDINSILRRVAGDRYAAAPTPAPAEGRAEQRRRGKMGIGNILARHRKKALVAIGGAILLAGGIQLVGTAIDYTPAPQVAVLPDPVEEKPVPAVQSRDPIMTGGIADSAAEKLFAEDRILPQDAFATPEAEASTPSPEAVRFIPEASDLPADLEPEALRQAALQGDGIAFFEIANRLVEGRGLEVDLEAAAIWYERAAEQGLGLAQYRIGNMYEKGTGVARSIENATKWYEAAAEQGNVNAMHNLGVLMAMGAEGEVNNKEAVRWFTEASDFDVTDSQFNLAILAAKGLGMPKDMTEAYKWFDIVARKGDADAAAKRDEVASALSPEELKVAEGKAMLWQARAVDPAANTVTVPVEWGGDVPLAGDSAEFKRAVANIQLILNKMGFDAGAADGIIGDKTRNAIRAFQSQNGMKATGEIDNELVKKLLEQNETA